MSGKTAKRLAIVGMGNMGQALAAGMLESGFLTPRQIAGVEADAGRADAVSRSLKIDVSADYGVIRNSSAIIIAVKPQNMSDLLSTLKPLLKDQLVISIAAGVTIRTIRAGLGNKRIVRTMPNTPALVSRGATGIYCTPSATASDRAFVEGVFGAIGRTVFVDKEEDIDKITALSGSGPAYVYYFMEALEDAGVMMGLPRDTARMLVAATFDGSAALLASSGKTPTALKEMVTSPGGTTIHGLSVMEKSGVKGAVHDAVMAAFRRAKELGG